MPNFSGLSKTILCSNSNVAAATDITNATVIDTAGYDAVRFIVGFGVITAGAVTSTGVSGKATNTPTPGTDDLANTHITVADTDDNTVVIHEITHPQQRYLRCFVRRATQNAVVDFILCELYSHTGKSPVTADATVSHTNVKDAPANGTV